MIRYDVLSRRRHAEQIRRLLPWPRTTYIGPLLPLFALTYAAVSRVGTAPWEAVAVRTAWLGVAVALAEIYSVCLHREAWIAAFEPHLIPVEARPLGGQPPHPDELGAGGRGLVGVVVVADQVHPYR